VRKSRLKSRPVKRYEKSFGSNGGECLAKDCVGGAQVYEMIELIHTRHSERDGHAMDVLMEALRKQRVQAHIARELQRALARAKDQRRGDGTPSPMSPQSNPPVVPTHRQSSLASVSTPGSTLTTPATSTGNSLASSPQRSKFDMHPQFGALPPGRPGKTLPPAPVQPSPDIDPVFGVRPRTPPQRRGAFRPTQEGGHPGLGEVATGLSGHFTSSGSDSLNTAATDSFSPPYQNGEGERPSGMDRRFSDISYTTTSVYSTTSTEQSALDYGSRDHREFVGGGIKLQEMEARYDDLRTMYQNKEQEVVNLKKENAYLREKYRVMQDQNMDLKKQYEQLREKIRNHTITEQKQILESYRPEKMEGSDEVAQLRRQLQEKDDRMALLEKQVEQYQQDNVQLQLSLSSNSARPHHLPIGSPMGRPPAIHRPACTPARSPYQGGISGPATGTGMTPMTSVRIGDSLNQHNIHLQQSQGSRRDSPAFSPAKDSGAGKRLSSGSGDNPMGETYYQSSNSSLNSSGSKGSAGVTLQTTPNAEHSTMV
jgi:hypothetical protein